MLPTRRTMVHRLTTGTRNTNLARFELHHKMMDDIEPAFQFEFAYMERVSACRRIVHAIQLPMCGVVMKRALEGWRNHRERDRASRPPSCGSFIIEAIRNACKYRG